MKLQKNIMISNKEQNGQGKMKGYFIYDGPALIIEHISPGPLYDLNRKIVGKILHIEILPDLKLKFNVEVFDKE